MVDTTKIAIYLLVQAALLCFDMTQKSGLLLLSLVLGNTLLWRFDVWASDRDKAARAAGVATSGWGGLNRWSEEREVRAKEKSG